MGHSKLTCALCGYSWSIRRGGKLMYIQLAAAGAFKEMKRN